MRVDSHQHFWRLARGDYGWMTPDLGAIYRDFEPADLKPLLEAGAINATVVVQAADTVAETEFLLSLADEHDLIAGVVGWIDMEAGDAVATLERLRQNPKFKGIRPMIQEIADDDWVLQPALDPVFDALAEMELCFDALVLPRHLPKLLKRLEEHPALACVIDHCAKPQLATGEIAEWKADIAAVANNTSALCKLSGLLTEAGDDASLEKIRPAAEHVLEVFGPSRLMFGSDWPVLNLAGDYAGWVEMVGNLLKSFPAPDCEAIWGGNAIRFYGLEI